MNLPANYPSKPEFLWKIFYNLTQIPRPSRSEQKVIKYLKELAEEKSLKYIIDRAGNIIIYVPGKNGREHDRPLIIQNHVDMVTDALPGVRISFQTDPIETFVDGDWLKAKGTTLGADNGIGCAAALATIYDETLAHPPLELLFTVDEETGLNGAQGLEHKYLSAKKMLNLDTEEWGSLYIGCAGGIDYELTKDVALVAPDSTLELMKLNIDGFIGGHSGVDIHEQRANAIKFLADVLDEFVLNSLVFQIAEIRGGKAHNIIPRDILIYFYVEVSKIDEIESSIQKVLTYWNGFLPKTDQGGSYTLCKEEHKELKVITPQDQESLLNYLLQFPHGAHSYDLEDRSLVGVSNNFARFLLINGKVYTQTSLRFFDREEIATLERRIKSLGRLFHMKVESQGQYPSWKPTRDNPVLEKIKSVYQDMYGKSPRITAIHAGLECGILRDKIGPIDVVSFGPTIMGAHSPDERVNIPSVTEFWDFFKNILATI